MTSNEDRSIAKYACDSCKSSKVTCSREQSGCTRCRKTGVKCFYSRSGILRRSRKRKHGPSESRQTNSNVSVKRNSIALESTDSGNDPRSFLATDIEATCEQLTSLDTPEQHSSFGALSSLSENCTATWIGHEASRLDMDKSISLFDAHAEEWVKVFENFLRRGGPLTRKPPPEVIEHLKASRPHHVGKRAWLVIYYTVILNHTTSESHRELLRRNLWLALSDISVLFQPSELNIHAMVLVLSHGSEFTGPSLCWMLATNACRMLQALGVNLPRLDQPTRERRLVTFWHLNLLDKGLAIIFGRNPTFHQEMVRSIGLPTLEQIQPFTPHVTSNGAPGFFGTHYMYQKILLSHLLDGIWHCLYGESIANEDNIEARSKDLESWHEQARKILEAAAMSEKPFCDLKNAYSIDVALHTIDFHFLYLSVLLTKHSAHKQKKCLDVSKKLLHILQHMAPESKEPYHPIIWQLVCCPFTPLLILFRDILSNKKGDSDENREAFAAMERLPKYLKAMAFRNSLAAKLEGIAEALVEHARSVVCHSESTPANKITPVGQDSRSLPEELAAGGPSSTKMSYLDSIFDDDAFIQGTPQSETTNPGSGIDIDLNCFLNSFDNDGMFDWLSWENPAQ